MLRHSVPVPHMRLTNTGRPSFMVLLLMVITITTVTIAIRVILPFTTGIPETLSSSTQLKCNSFSLPLAVSFLLQSPPKSLLLKSNTNRNTDTATTKAKTYIVRRILPVPAVVHRAVHLDHPDHPAQSGCNISRKETSLRSLHPIMNRQKSSSTSVSLQLDDHPIQRRFVIQNGIVAMAMMTMNPVHADAASGGYVRGAAELDLEYYLRDLFGNQNERVGNILPSAPPPMKPPRIITNPLLNILLNDQFSYSNNDGCCCTIRALVDTVLKQTQEQRTTLQLESDIHQSILVYKEKVYTSFNQRAAWNMTAIADQYYFDMISYTIWKTAATLLPNSIQRSQYSATLGRYIYQSFIQQQLIQPRAPNKDSSNHPQTLSSTNEKVLEILNIFSKCGFIQSYRIGGGSSSGSGGATTNDNSNQRSQQQSLLFDSYDDEAFQNQSSIDVLISIYESATLGASLQLTGEQSRFLPDFIGPTLMAMWYDTILCNTSTRSNGLSISYETYFLDSTYRPNPKGKVIYIYIYCRR